MDHSEALVARYLQHVGFTDIVYEPDGNVPPDFAVNGSIAVEVRRLNKHVQLDGEMQPLETFRFTMLRRISTLLKGFGAPNKGNSWFVHFRFKRPVHSWKSIHAEARPWLHDFRKGPQDGPLEALFNGFKLGLFPSSTVHEDLFVLGGFVDRDAGGWVIPDLSTNLAHCIEEKLRKTAPFRHRYETWWLVLIDQITYGAAGYDREFLQRNLPAKDGWDRVILVSPLDHTRTFEL